jgi:6,7-dimethyl-8-ribityllumazine synthase
MATKNKNLSSGDSVSLGSPEKIKIGIVVSDWNKEITHTLRDGCKQALLSHKIDQENITIINVPGAFELPYGAKTLLSHDSFDAVICLGCVIKGETKHDEYINNATALSIQQLSLLSGTPVIYGVLTPNDNQQAKDRAGGKHGNKGVEAANTAMHLIKLKQDFKSTKKSIGY